MHHHPRGFTLIEAMIAMAIAAILLAVAVPTWSNAMSAAHNGATRSMLATSLLAAVQHSGLTGVEVVLCPDTGAVQCSGSVDWSGGWLAFVDLNGNRLREPNETLLKQAAALAGGVRLRTTVGRTRLVFKPNGGNVGSNVTFTLCDARGLAHASTLVLANDGRLRQGKPTAAAAQACVYGD